MYPLIIALVEITSLEVVRCGCSVKMISLQLKGINLLDYLCTMLKGCSISEDDVMERLSSLDSVKWKDLCPV